MLRMRSYFNISFLIAITEFIVNISKKDIYFYLIFRYYKSEVIALGTIIDHIMSIYLQCEPKVPEHIRTALQEADDAFLNSCSKEQLALKGKLEKARLRFEAAQLESAFQSGFSVGLRLAQEVEQKLSDEESK